MGWLRNVHVIQASDLNGVQDNCQHSLRSSNSEGSPTFRWPRKCCNSFISRKARLAKIFLLKMLVIFLIATPSLVVFWTAALWRKVGVSLGSDSIPGARKFEETAIMAHQTTPYAPWPSSFVTVYCSSTTKSWWNTLKTLRPGSSAMLDHSDFAQRESCAERVTGWAEISRSGGKKIEMSR